MRRLPALLLAAALVACKGAPPTASDPPPPERAEDRGRRPGPDHFWQQGHWSWDEGERHYFWTSGGWAEERPGWIWFPGHWRPVDKDGTRAWEWVEDRWVRLADEKR